MVIYQANPPRKLDKLLDHMRAERWEKAISLAAGWPNLGSEAKAIRQAQAARLSPALYRQMKKDPDALFREGVEALKRRYGKYLN